MISTQSHAAQSLGTILDIWPSGHHHLIIGCRRKNEGPGCVAMEKGMKSMAGIQHGPVHGAGGMKGQGGEVPILVMTGLSWDRVVGVDIPSNQILYDNFTFGIILIDWKQVWPNIDNIHTQHDLTLGQWPQHQASCLHPWSWYWIYLMHQLPTSGQDKYMKYG